MLEERKDSNSLIELTSGPFALHSDLGYGYDQIRIIFGAGNTRTTTKIIFHIYYGVMIFEPFGMIQTISSGTNF